MAIGPTSGPDATPKVEVSVAIDPTEPSRMLAGAMDYDRIVDPACCWGMSIHTSSDGGATWTDRGNVVLMGNDAPFGCADAVGADPSVLFDRNGVAYYAYLSYAAGFTHAQGCPPDWTLAVTTSRDGGATWDTPVVVARAYADGSCAPDRDALAYDPSSDRVYLAWASLGCAGFAPAIAMASSPDQGRTWTAPVGLNESDAESAYGVSARVGPDGTVYAAYYRRAAFAGCPYLIGTTDGELSSAEAVVAISRDHGATWIRRVVGAICDDEYQTPDQPWAMVGGADFSWPNLAVDPATGLVGVAWAHRDYPFPTIHVTASSDGGETWSSHAAVGDLGRGAHMPALAAAGGVLRLLYMSINQAGLYDAVYRESADGAAWSGPTVLNSAILCSCWTPLGGRYGIGHYAGLDAQAGRIVTAWPDGRDPLGVPTIYGRAGSY